MASHEVGRLAAKKCSPSLTIFTLKRLGWNLLEVVAFPKQNIFEEK